MDKIIENGINDIIDNYYKFFLNKKNVIGLGLGHKFINELNTKELCLQLFVENKCAKNMLYKNDLIPNNFLGIKTDVIEFKYNKFISYTPITVKNTIDIKKLSLLKRPIQPGYSIGIAYTKSAGTLGAIVFDNEDNLPCILSNNHVLVAKNKENELDSPIVQPSYLDYKSNTEPVAYLYKKITRYPYIEKEKNHLFNFNDCAISKLYPDIDYTESIYKLGKIRGITNPLLDMPIRKVGITTGYTAGNIISINSSILVKASDGKNFFYKNQIISTLKCDSGDSGSIVLDFYNRVIGLLMSSNGITSTINPITPILNYLNIHFNYI